MILLTLLTSSLKTKEELWQSPEYEQFYSDGGDLTNDVRFIIREQKFDDLFLDVVNLINLLLSNRKDIIIFVSSCYIALSTLRKINRDFSL